MIYISKVNYQKLIEHGKKEFPLECCGLLGGTLIEDGIIIKEIYPLTNTDHSSEHFSMDPREQLTVIKNIRELGHVLLGNYHSHPYTPSRPSEEDKKLAYDPNMIYGIVSLEKEEPILNFFMIKPSKQIEKLCLKIIA